MNELLTKYWDGNTTLDEQRQLINYFKQQHIDPEHEVYRPIFASLSQQQDPIEFDAFDKIKTQAQQHKSKTPYKTIISIAAGFALLIALGTFIATTTNNEQQMANLGTYDDPQQAYDATLQALQMVAVKMNHGRSNLKPLQQIDSKTNQVFNTTINNK